MEPTSTPPIIALTALVGNDVPRFNAMQEFLAPYAMHLVVFWWFVWLVTALVLIRFVYRYGIREGDPQDREMYSKE